MGEKIVVGPIEKGLKTNRLPFNIDNDSFPTLLNAYNWRGRVKRKRGTQFLVQLTRFFNSLSTAYNPGSTTITLGNDGSGNGTGNILTGFTTLQSNASLALGSITINDITNGATYTDPDMNGTLRKNGAIDLGSTVNYSSGAIVIAGRAGDTINANFDYYPKLPVMGLEDLNLNATQFPGTIGFDTTYSYNINTTIPSSSYDVSFYKNPASGTYTNGSTPYVAKTTQTPVTWNGFDYQQFWSVNYQGAFWATNGININPTTLSNIGMQFQKPNSATRNSPTQMTFVINSCPLVQGDFVFANEWTATTVINSNTLNWQTGYVASASNPGGTSTIVVIFPNANISSDTYSNGILQYLTNRSDITKDCIRWYDGDPTTVSSTKGWVNFSPPLSQGTFSIDDKPATIYYLVGCRMILPFKDRMVFFGPVIQSSGGSKFYLQDTVIYSQNGTPYYTSSYNANPFGTILNPTNSSITFFPIIAPDGPTGANQFTATAPAYFEDSPGFGGFQTVGVDQPMITVSPNEDALIVGFNTLQTRMLYTGNDLVPFSFYIINSELGSGSTFSAITTDDGVFSRGTRGYIITGQTQANRIDLEIPDSVFQIALSNNGNERFTAQRDFINEWIYFTYPSNQSKYVYPSQTLQFNYRDNSWGVFNENYTTYGSFRPSTGYTWATIGQTYPTWASWNVPWSAGQTTLLQPLVIAGNQQGFVLIRDAGSTQEASSLSIQSFSGSIITSPNHCLNNGDYIVINNCLGTIGTVVNGNIYSIANATTNTFQLNPTIASGTYLGNGTITRMYLPYVQTKQFPVAWGLGRKTRIGPQQYLLTKTNKGQITLLIFLSQDSANAYNDLEFPRNVVLIPNSTSENSTLIYSSILYTCVESVNLGLTPANTNLQMIAEINSSGTNASSPQSQIWHRMNTSLIGDTVQIGFTLSDSQMRDINFNNQFEEIELHGFILDVQPSQMLC